MANSSAAGLAARIDWGTLSGLLLAFTGILGGLILEGGKLQDVAQITAAAIVLGGTLGAVLVGKPIATVWSACRRFREVILIPPEPEIDEIIRQLLESAKQVRRLGIASLETVAQDTSEPFLCKAFGIAADGVDSRELRRIMELEIEAEQRRFDADAGVFEAAGGYAPTIGIIGAVLGLIQVMKHLDRLEEVGRGIAVAFVATVYGVALANLILLPVAEKIQARGKRSGELHELILTGVLAIAAGTNPRLVKLQLDAYREASPPVEGSPPHNPDSVKVRQIG